MDEGGLNFGVDHPVENDEADLESFWQAVRAPRAIKLIDPGDWNVLKGIEIAAGKTNLELARIFADLRTEGVEPALISKIATRAIGVFLDHWYEELRHADLSTLVAVVLEGARLPVEELKGFVRSMPPALVDRIVSSIGPTASGLQALMTVEQEWRKVRGRDYELSRDLDGRLLVTAYFPRLGGEPLTFRLDERYGGVENRGVNQSENGDAE